MDTAALPMAWDELEQPFAVNVGNPHLVFFVPDAREVPLETLGPRIENDPAFPERINVNVELMSRPSETAYFRTRCRRDARLRHRCLRERGRGNRYQARPIAGAGRHDRGKPDRRVGSRGSPIRMRGGATYVFSGELDLEALQ